LIIKLGYFICQPVVYQQIMLLYSFLLYAGVEKTKVVD
jgi:hypothetical protein